MDAMIHESRIVATFSIVALDMHNGDLGVAVQSKFLAVGSIVPWASASAGAIATQAHANISYGPDGLRLLEAGASADEALARLLANDDGRDHRQIGIVDRQGRAAAFTGSACHSWAGHRTGKGFACQGNILAGAGVVDAMAEAFVHSTGELAERLVAALGAGQEAGGDRRGRQSAAVYVARAGGSYGGHLDRYVDLRVDDHANPIVELERLLRLASLLSHATSRRRLYADRWCGRQRTPDYASRSGLLRRSDHRNIRCCNTRGADTLWRRRKPGRAISRGCTDRPGSSTIHP